MIFLYLNIYCENLSLCKLTPEG